MHLHIDLTHFATLLSVLWLFLSMSFIHLAAASSPLVYHSFHGWWRSFKTIVRCSIPHFAQWSVQSIQSTCHLHHHPSPISMRVDKKLPRLLVAYICQAAQLGISAEKKLPRKTQKSSQNCAEKNAESYAEMVIIVRPHLEECYQNNMGFIETFAISFLTFSVGQIYFKNNCGEYWWWWWCWWWC